MIWAIYIYLCMDRFILKKPLNMLLYKPIISFCLLIKCEDNGHFDPEFIDFHGLLRRYPRGQKRLLIAI